MGRQMKSGMYMPWIAALAVLVLASTSARAGVTFQIMGDGYATDLSVDGRVVVGIGFGGVETFRWTQAGGSQPLGNSGCMLGLACAGTAGVSWDGTRVTAGIANADTTFATMGLWTSGGGWQELLPPAPADAGVMDRSLASSWGLSGDGSTAVGLYWRNGAPHGTGSAHACRWTQAGGAVDLGSAGTDSRANGTSYDGRVIAGWAANPVTGAWWPTVWVDGAMTVLDSTAGFAEASAVDRYGNVVVGQSYDTLLIHSVAALWRRNGTHWDKTVIGSLPGTFAYYGNVIANDVTADGSTIVGYNAFSGNTDQTGFIWTQADGMVDVEQYLAANGITVPFSFNIQALSAISADGSTMVGTGSNVFPPWNSSWFMIHRDPTSLAVAPAVAGGLQFRAFPNPTPGATRLSFELSEPADVSLGIFDIAGRQVLRLAEGPLGVGRHVFESTGRGSSGATLAPGLYFAKLRVGSLAESRSIVLTH